MTDDSPQKPSGDMVFCFSYLSWTAAARRGWFGTEDRLAKGLIENERVTRLLVCDQMRSLPIVVARDLIGQLRGARAGDSAGGAFPASSTTQLLRPIGMRREYPTSIAGVERVCKAFDRATQRKARRMGLVEPSIVVAHPLLAGFAEFEWATRVTFFATDDWLAYEPQRPWWGVYEESFARVRERKRRVGAVSAAALERIAPTGESAVIPNGIDPAEWLGAAGEPPDWARERDGPLLVYAGTLDSRIDVTALLTLARRTTEARIVLVGPLLDARHLEPLREMRNVEIHQELPREKVIALIRAADVGLVPHRDSALTRAMSPLKLYEYLAAGLPVVASDLAPMRDVDASVFLVSDSEDYPAALDAALAHGRTQGDAREAFIARHSWRARHEALLDLVLG